MCWSFRIKFAVELKIVVRWTKVKRHVFQKFAHGQNRVNSLLTVGQSKLGLNSDSIKCIGWCNKRNENTFFPHEAFCQWSYQPLLLNRDHKLNTMYSLRSSNLPKTMFGFHDRSIICTFLRWIRKFHLIMRAALMPLAKHFSVPPVCISTLLGNG